MLPIPHEKRISRAKHASSAAVLAMAERIANDPLVLEFGKETVLFTKHLGAAAKQRCTNPNTVGYANYGGRGIKFAFPSVRVFAEWVLRNLGAKPSNEYSLDRIDNNAHYEPGNLRWATRSEQARNKRAYKRTLAGMRIKKLQALRPDLTYETLRLWVSQGVSDAEITQRKKYARTSI